jgi:NADPH:quinone reductase-like Zn-dependent oxidoreductase
MIIRLAKHDGIRAINVVRRREAAQELKDLGADAVIVSGDGPIDEQVHNIVGPQGVGFAIDPVAGQTGTEMFRSLSEGMYRLFSQAAGIARGTAIGRGGRWCRVVLGGLARNWECRAVRGVRRE